MSNPRMPYPDQPLITDSQFLKREFTLDARRSKSWVRSKVEQGLIPGVIVGNEVFIDYPAWLQMRGIPRDTRVSAKPDKIQAACQAILSR